MEEKDTPTVTIPEMVDEMRAGKMSRRELVKSLAALGISTAGIGAITAVASRAIFTHFTQAAPVPQKSEQDLHLHQQHLAHQLKGDIPALQQDYADHAIVEDSMLSRPFIGREAIISRKNKGMAAIPDLHIHVTGRVTQGGQLTVEWVATGTHSGDFPDLPASGRTFSIQGVTVVVREHGKIVRESIYYDMDEVRRQLHKTA
ncbi:MAG TPA: ester cyclase [Ktedonobacteraceae bacterium]|nr:ester cyclase [Ktedonobacteraceae bacterium]